MAELKLTLSEEERAFLVEFFEAALKDTLVEEHRTRKPSFREAVLHQEDLIAGLLSKLKQAAR